MQGCCSQAGTRVVTNSKRYVKMTATIGENVYTLAGHKLLPPGNYKAHFLDNGKIELIGPNAKGELHVHKFAVIASEAKNSGN
jgi:hypothetical protein